MTTEQIPVFNFFGASPVTSVITVTNANGDPQLIIHLDGRLELPGMVTLHQDGRVDFHDDYTPDDAARQFWAAVEMMKQSMNIKQ